MNDETREFFRSIIRIKVELIVKNDSKTLFHFVRKMTIQVHGDLLVSA